MRVETDRRGPALLAVRTTASIGWFRGRGGVSRRAGRVHDLPAPGEMGWSRKADGLGKRRDRCHGAGVSYRDLFKALTGFYPYAYQERVEERLLAGDSIILRVPTGAGKTWAAVAPFVYSVIAGQREADRLLYA